MSAFGGKADIMRTCTNVRFCPKADIAQLLWRLMTVTTLSCVDALLGGNCMPATFFIVRSVVEPHLREKLEHWYANDTCRGH